MIWLLHDTSNSNPLARNYVWKFGTRAEAARHLRHQTAKGGASLIGPFPYRLAKERDRKARGRARGHHFERLPAVIWVLDEAERKYITWYETRRIALESRRHDARLCGYEPGACPVIVRKKRLVKLVSVRSCCR